MKSSLMIGWTTVDSESSAVSLAHKIIERKLAVCVQIDPAVQSIYRWKGTVQSEREWRLMIKFTCGQGDGLSEYIHANHPYEVPEWIVIQADQVASAYQRWASQISV